mmetsp:Transcript_4676/g.15484  ORF Transcript_4676/g.15484 Transcript_4676/m.15484 type:complete len:271 (-) Transcript_4676:1464-2276(-)
MTCVGGICSSSLILELRYWLSSTRSSSFCLCKLAVSSSASARLLSRRLYLPRFFSRAPHTRNILGEITLDILSQNSFSRSALRPLLLTMRFPLTVGAAAASLSTKSLRRLAASSGWMSTGSRGSPSSGSSPPSLRHATSASNAGPSLIPSARTIESARRASPSSPTAPSSARASLASTRKPLSLTRSLRSARYLGSSMRSRSAWAAASAASCSPSSFSCLSASFIGETNSSSSGGFQLTASCCSWMILSARSTLCTSSAATPSFMSHTST